MRFILLFVCALALFASVSAAPCYSNRCGGQTGGYGGGGGRSGGGGGGRGGGGRGGCPTCGVSNFGNGDHNANVITVSRHYG
ncbi:hypothetical protein KGM_215311 [Danaus plexippus plexippus]|uniref:Uncharacterized protein n=1 Tax=Danaus plexippus plexippus TaxID=278856 RepID=A0A212EWB5_DANPL|nr:hypothetical protein KGM_215311 [Danaus plexippus plexippus]